MSLDVYLEKTMPTVIFEANITHNLGKMASKVNLGENNLCQYLWRPEEINIKLAGELIQPLTEGLKELQRNKKKYEKHNAENGWGTYEHFLPFIEEYLNACKENPDAKIMVSR